MNLHRVYMLIAALRTGVIVGPFNATMPIEQGKNALERNLPNGNKQQCCLGVACYVARLNGLDLKIKGPQYPFVSDANYSHEEYRPTYFDFAEETSWLPSNVISWYGFHEASPYLPLIGEGAASANDAGYTFADIADGFEDLVRQELGLTRLVLAEERHCQHHEYTGRDLANGAPTYNGTRCFRMTLPGVEWCSQHRGSEYFAWKAQQAVEQVAAETGESIETVQQVADAMAATTEETEWED